ncbi:MAG TPA: PQQ-binding-like beta-propeller repeat protein, partial [Casimicrobiaceae bacterium]
TTVEGPMIVADAVRFLDNAHGGLRRRVRAAALAIVAAYALAAVAPVGAAEASDPIEGRWVGTAGVPGKEQIIVGLEFRRAAGGALKLYLSEPILNMYNVENTGAIERAGDKVVVKDFAMTLALDGDRLEGTFPGPSSKAVFQRATALPQPPSVPDVPRGPGPRWETRLNGQVFAAPAVADGIVYVGSTGGVFNALKAGNGERVWTFAAGRPIYGEALVDGDAVYFVCDNGYLFKLRRASGEEAWRYDLGDSRVSRIPGHPAVHDWDWQAPKPVIAGGVVYVGAGDGSVHAVDATSGVARWRASLEGRVRTTAAVDASRVIVASTSGVVHALARATGKALWTHDTGAHIDTAPVVFDGNVVLGNRGFGLTALKADTGEPVWRTYFWGSWVESTPRVVDGVLYIGSSDLRRVSAIDIRDGNVLWRTDVFGWTWGTPLVTADRIYVGAAGGKPYFIDHVASFTVLDRKTGRMLERWPLPDSPGAHQWGIGGSLALSGDTIVATTIDGAVYGFPLRS